MGNYRNDNLLTKQNIDIQFVLLYIEIIRAWLLYIVQAESSVARVIWSLNVVCVDYQPEWFHGACWKYVSSVNKLQVKEVDMKCFQNKVRNIITTY
jgi:hypothetical protein